MLGLTNPGDGVQGCLSRPRAAGLTWRWKHGRGLRDRCREPAITDASNGSVERRRPAGLDPGPRAVADVETPDLARGPVNRRTAPLVAPALSEMGLDGGLAERALIVRSRSAEKQELRQGRRECSREAGVQPSPHFLHAVAVERVGPRGLHGLDVAAAPKVGESRAVVAGEAEEDPLNQCCRRVRCRGWCGLGDSGL